MKILKEFKKNWKKNSKELSNRMEKIISQVIIHTSPNSEGKFSYHIIFNNVVFNDKHDLTLFFSNMKENY